MKAYEKKYMSTSDMLLKQTKRKSEEKVLATLQHRKLMAYESKSDLDSSKAKESNNSSSGSCKEEGRYSYKSYCW